MPYISKDFEIKESAKAWAFLTREMGLTMREAQRAIDRGQLLINGAVVEQKSQMLSGVATFLYYEPRPKGLVPIYENAQFALFDKPSGVLAHPRNRHTEYSMNDEIKHLYGKNANIVHRLDKETSGLLLVAKEKESERGLKRLFERKEVRKSYVALSRGRIDEAFVVDAPILVNHEFSLIKLKVYIDERGKPSVTEFEPIRYFDDLDATLVRCRPRTGRQHQIRAHLFHVEHPILGDPIYGVSAQVGADYLDGKLNPDERVRLCGAGRILLHSDELEFCFDGVQYSFKSQLDAASEFENIVRSGG